MGPKSRNHFTILQTIYKTNIRIWDCFYHNCFGNCHHKNTKSPELFIRLALRLPKYVSARLLHEASGLPYVRERLITAGQNHLARMHMSPFVEHTIDSTRTNIAWDKYKTPISIFKLPDWSTDTNYRMQENEVTSVNIQQLTPKVVVRPVHGQVWHSPRTQNQSQHGYLVVAFIDATKSYNGWTMGRLTHYSTLQLTATVYLR